MYPLTLLPVVADDLNTMDSRVGLRYQTSFMKNALIRALNNIYEQAERISDGENQDFKPFMAYCQIVGDMLRLQYDGDNLFFVGCGTGKVSLDEILGGAWTRNAYWKRIPDTLKIWDARLRDYLENPATYRATDLRALLEEMEGPLTKGLFGLIEVVTPEVISQNFGDEEMQIMIGEHILWLSSNSDLTVLLPFCTSHHDPSTSKFWPVITEEGLAALPGLAEQHASQWALAPFDPVKRVKN
ncbi:hypothetical protein MD484_g4108, partial [Candolleomyces efflorescens]